MAKRSAKPTNVNRRNWKVGIPKVLRPCFVYLLIVSFCPVFQFNSPCSIWNYLDVWFCLPRRVLRFLPCRVVTVFSLVNSIIEAPSWRVPIGNNSALMRYCGRFVLTFELENADWNTIQVVLEHALVVMSAAQLSMMVFTRSFITPMIKTDARREICPVNISR